MFKALHALAQSATLMIVVTAEADDLRVSVTPTQVGDKTKAHKLSPLSLLASPAELDEGFIAAIEAWQAPKRTLLQQVADANATNDDGDDGAGGDGAAKDKAPKKSGAGRPKKNSAAAAPAPATDSDSVENEQAGATPPAPPVGPAALGAAVDTLTLDLF